MLLQAMADGMDVVNLCALTVSAPTAVLARAHECPNQMPVRTSAMGAQLWVPSYGCPAMGARPCTLGQSLHRDCAGGLLS